MEDISFTCPGCGYHYQPKPEGPRKLLVTEGQFARTPNGCTVWFCGRCTDGIGNQVFRDWQGKARTSVVPIEIVEVQMGDGYAYYRNDDGTLIYKVDNRVTDELRGLGHIVIEERAPAIDGQPPASVHELFQQQSDVDDGEIDGGARG